MKKILTLLLLILMFGFVEAQTPAFPGAEGGGMYTTGGRGGIVYYVTTLEDDANLGNLITKEGSLRWCLNRTGKRTIVFKVGGTIRLNSGLSIKNGNVTIAGQTAPGDGICIADYPVGVSADNVIIRYLRFRMGDDKLTADEADGADALGGRSFKNVIVDHCSVSWSTDECASFYDCHNFTFQWSMITESLRMSKHSKGSHGYGAIWGGTNSTFHHNLLAHHDSRTPRFGPGKNTIPHTEVVDFRNNVNYNHGNTYGGEGMSINLINNYYKPNSASNTGAARGRILCLDIDKNVGSTRYMVWGQLYVDGNVIDDGKNEANCIRATNDNWTYGIFNQFHSSNMPVSDADKAKIKQENPLEIKGLLSDGSTAEVFVTTHSARTAFDKVTEYAGASLRRDSYDARIINEARTGTTTYKGASTKKYGIIDSHWDLKPAGAGDDWTPWPVLASGDAPIDSDSDGIPDGWLDANGYSGKASTDLNEEGYTYLEVYLNSLVAEITQKQNADAQTGIEDRNIINRNDLNVYFDSSSKELHVKAADVIESIMLYNLTGVLLHSEKPNAVSSILSMSKNSNSILILKVATKNKNMSTIKVVI